MTTIRLPHNWKPRPYQMKAWGYWERGGKYTHLCWHRRSGKDEIALHRTAVAAFERVGAYWHLLPEAAHARKAIWTMVNPHTGKRRIDEAFPIELRKTTREQEMFIEFVNGSTWQVGGSDRYNTLVGSSPAGVTFSEWALANPAAWAYVSPILLENGGWATFITTPRGHNHAERMYKAAKKMPGAFAQLLTVDDTGIFQKEALLEAQERYISEYGEEYGRAMFDQEYYCSFDAAVMGSYYGQWVTTVRNEGRIRAVPIDHEFPVHCAWDIGHTDDTAIWFYQAPGREVHIVGFHSSNGQDAEFYIDFVHKWMHEHKSKMGNMHLPHDAKAKTFASGKSVQEQFADAFGWDKIHIVPSLSIQDGIQAVRKMFPRTYFNDDIETEAALDMLGQYQRKWDQERKVFLEHPLHDFTSHCADAFRMLAIAVEAEKVAKPDKKVQFDLDMTIDQMIAKMRAKRISEE